jgi:serine protease Do
MRRGAIDLRMAFLLTAAAFAAALLLPFAVRRTAERGTLADSATLQAQAVVRDALQDTLLASRRTAIVRAAELVAPATVSVNVIRRETVRPRTWFEQFMIGPGISREVQGLGSGFIIDAAGLVLTNEHVVRGATEIVVTLSDGRDVRAEIVGLDDVTDLALLRLSGRPGGLRVAELGSSGDLMTGEWVVAVGNPFGYLLSNPEPTVTVGVVSGIGRNIIPSAGSEDSRGYYLDMIQTDAAINPGNSGGPLVNLLGKVVGVNSSIISESGGSVGLGFAIPIDRARRIADALLREGQVRRVWVGVEVRQDTAQPGRPRRVRVSNVVAGSPAARAGLRSGMVLETVNGRTIRSPFDWEARLLDTRVGETLEVAVSQAGTRRSLRVPTQDLPSLGAERIRALADFEFVTLTPAIQAERGLASTEGALIVSLSAAARDIGLQQGDLVLEINRQRVRTAQEAASLLRRLSGRRVSVTFERQGQLGSIAFYIGG